MKKWKNFLIIFIVIFGIGFGIAYIQQGDSPVYFLEDCAKSCQPLKGEIVRRGPTVGPEWRPTSHNLVCVCK